MHFLRFYLPAIMGSLNKMLYVNPSPLFSFKMQPKQIRGIIWSMHMTRLITLQNLLDFEYLSQCIIPLTIFCLTTAGLISTRTNGNPSPAFGRLTD